MGIVSAKHIDQAKNYLDWNKQRSVADISKAVKAKVLRPSSSVKQ